MVADTHQKIGLAVFVKTPGLSPIKTRLAAGIGAAHAARFYELAVEALRSVVQPLRGSTKGAPTGVDVFWAVAEGGGAGHWQDLPVIPQGEGGLGTRIATVYASLRRQGYSPMLIGADAPQLSEDVINLAVKALVASDFVVGPARDGGFYLFAGRCDVPGATFERLHYSVSTTGAELVAALAPHGKIATLQPLTDVDTSDDLSFMTAEIEALRAPTAAQRQLVTWLASRRF